MAVITFAHRGARSEYPDNTLKGFARAIDLGASGLETDARLSADGEVVLAHDATIGTGLRRIRVSEHSAESLAQLQVPRLADLYAAQDSDFACSIDCQVPEAALPIIEVARAARAADRLWLCSPDLDLLAGLRSAAPEIKLVHSPGREAPPAATMERHASQLSRLGIDAMNMHHRAWTGGLVSLYHRFGLNVFAWDAQEIRQLKAMLRIGIDAVYCDNVVRMVSTVKEWEGQ